MNMIDIRRRFVLEWQEELEDEILSLLESHKVFSRLPSDDLVSAARCAATRALLAIRSTSIEALQLVIDNEPGPDPWADGTMRDGMRRYARGGP